MSPDERNFMANEVSAEIVTEIVESIFVTMMDLQVSASETPWLPAGDRMTSSVYLEGDWNGAISLECNREQACRFAGRLLAMDPPDTVDDDVRDALGELANMIGGNLKSSMTMQTRLSMPSVIDGGDYELRICGSEVKNRLAFRVDGGHFWVTVRSKERQNFPAARQHSSTC
jgi:chemotaxis protein CheX